MNVVAPLGATTADIARLPDADFNICLYPEIADTACRWLAREHGQPVVTTVPIGHGATRDFIAELAALTGIDPTGACDLGHLPWWSRSVDSTYLTGKRVFIFGDATHAIAAARVARDELGFEVVGLGCYNREFARDLRTAAALYGVTPLITDDYLVVEEAIQALQPELVLGTQMERHIAKRLRIPCAVISAPVQPGHDRRARHVDQPRRGDGLAAAAVRAAARADRVPVGSPCLAARMEARALSVVRNALAVRRSGDSALRAAGHDRRRHIRPLPTAPSSIRS